MIYKIVLVLVRIENKSVKLKHIYWTYKYNIHYLQTKNRQITINFVQYIFLIDYDCFTQAYSTFNYYDYKTYKYTSRNFHHA